MHPIIEKRMALPPTKNVFNQGPLPIDIYQPCFPQLDLADEAEWESVVEHLSLEEAGLEEDYMAVPDHGHQSVHAYIDWFYDGEDSRYECN